ncbi:MAG: hypothetical protein Q7K57_11200 [Burkholderiaceae bacterium]|nr:hypothetical protein [Burkholderiaceae bacterium]
MSGLDRSIGKCRNGDDQGRQSRYRCKSAHEPPEVRERELQFGCGFTIGHSTFRKHSQLPGQKPENHRTASASQCDLHFLHSFARDHVQQIHGDVALSVCQQGESYESHQRHQYFRQLCAAGQGAVEQVAADDID